MGGEDRRGTSGAEVQLEVHREVQLKVHLEVQLEVHLEAQLGDLEHLLGGQLVALFDQIYLG